MIMTHQREPWYMYVEICPIYSLWGKSHPKSDSYICVERIKYTTHPFDGTKNECLIFGESDAPAWYLCHN